MPNLILPIGLRPSCDWGWEGSALIKLAAHKPCYSQAGTRVASQAKSPYQVFITPVSSGIIIMADNAALLSLSPTGEDQH